MTVSQGVFFFIIIIIHSLQSYKRNLSKKVPLFIANSVVLYEVPFKPSSFLLVKMTDLCNQPKPLTKSALESHKIPDGAGWY